MNEKCLRGFCLLRKGQVGAIFLFLIILGVIGLYYGHQQYMEKYYISFYDGSITRYLEIPPFTQRISPGYYELFGRCSLRFATAIDQFTMAFESSCRKRGFFLKALKEKDSFEVEIAPKYKIHCQFSENVMEMSWNPTLTESLQKKIAKLTPPPPLATASAALKKK